MKVEKKKFQGTADIVHPRDVQDHGVTSKGPLFHFTLSYLLVFVMVSRATSLQAHNSSDFFSQSEKFLAF